MSVLGFSSKLLNTKFSAVLLMVFSLVLTGCGANGELVNPFEQASSSETGSTDENETSDNVGGEDGETETPEPQRVLNLVSQPSNVSITEGENLTFSVTVEHSHPILVTWFKDNAVIQSTSSTNITVNSAGTYDCLITDGTLIESCDGFVLQVDTVQFVDITSQPGNQVVSEGENVSLSVQAVASGALSYQWYVDDSAISGATSSVLTLSDVTLNDQGSYKCVVTSGNLTETSSTASLSVSPVVGSVEITWSAPSQRADGSDLAAADIAAYEIHYSASAGGELTLIDTVAAGSENVFNMEGMSKGIHYFALATVDKNDLKSDLSSAIAVTID